MISLRSCASSLEPGPTTSDYHLKTFYPETFTETYTEYIHFIIIIVIVIII